jgi:hypothetical protein
MSVFLDSQYLRLWTDGTSSILFAKVKAVPERPFDVMDLCDKMYDFSSKIRKEQKQEVYSIIDAESLEEFGMPSECFIGKLLKAQVRAKVSHQAIIVNPNHGAMYSFTSEQLPLAHIHQDFISALSYLNYLREKSTLTLRALSLKAGLFV